MQRHEPEVMPDNHAHSHVEILLPVGDLTYRRRWADHCQRRYISVLWGQIPHRQARLTVQEKCLLPICPCQSCCPGRCRRFLSALFTGQVISGTQNEDADSLHFRRWHDDYHSRDSELVQIADRNYNSGCADSLLQAGIWGLPPR